ncbi:glycosyltransferase [candidate division KSB1 bacterium]|nr:glycosyltransferase [candidate division KSB1 bacterium]
MKSVLVATHDRVYPLYGGGSHRALNLCKKLSNNGYKVSLLAPSVKDRLDKIIVKNIKFFEDYKSKIVGGFFSLFEAFIKSIKLVKENPLIIGIGALVMIPLFVWGKIFGKRIISSPTDINSEYMIYEAKESNNLLLGIFSRFLNILELYTIINADGIIVVSEEMKKYLLAKRARAEKITVIYDGYNPKLGLKNKFRCNLKKGGKVNFVHHGSIDAREDISTLIDAVKILKNKGISNFQITFTGKGLRELQETVIKEEIDKFFIFSGWLSNEELAATLENSDFGLILRKNILPNNLITTIKIFDYWASGTIPIVSDLKGIREIATLDEALFFTPEDPNSLTEQMQYAIKNFNELFKIREDGFKMIDKYNFNVTANKTFEFIINLYNQ